MAIKLQSSELKSKSIQDLKSQAEELRKELSSIRVQKATKTSSNKISHSRNIARVLTAIKHKELRELAIQFKGKKIKPIELRPKLTRAMRKALTPNEKNRQIPKLAKRGIAFPKRVYAIKA